MTDFLETLMKREDERHAARMALRGDRPHAPERGWLFAGMSVFQASAAFVDDASTAIRIRVSFQLRRPRNDVIFAWGEPWPDDGSEVDAQDLLEALAVHWPAIAGPYLLTPVAGGQVDLGAILDLPTLKLSWIGGAEMVVEAAEGRNRPGSEQVIVVETLTGLGQMLRDRVAAAGERGSAIAKLWDAALELTDLPPTPVTEAMLESPAGHEDLEAAWYAGKLGIELATYKLNAILLQARQTIFAVEGVGQEPTAREWMASGFRERLDPAEVEALAARASTHVADGDVEAFKADALHVANINSRQVVIYGAR